MCINQFPLLFPQDIFEVLSQYSKGRAADPTYAKDGGFLKVSTRDDVVACILKNEIAEDMSKLYVSHLFEYSSTIVDASNEVREMKYYPYVNLFCFQDWSSKNGISGW